MLLETGVLVKLIKLYSVQQCDFAHVIESALLWKKKKNNYNTQKAKSK